MSAYHRHTCLWTRESSARDLQCVVERERRQQCVNQDVIAVEMTENDKRPSMVIGYWMSDRKSQKLNWIEFGKVCRLDELFLSTHKVLSRFIVFCFIGMHHYLHRGHFGKTFRRGKIVVISSINTFFCQVFQKSELIFCSKHYLLKFFILIRFLALMTGHCLFT